MCLPEYKGKLTLFAGVDNVRFKNMVRPGDKFEMHVELILVSIEPAMPEFNT